jgi:glycosyltransferase involved in cell wall biosynthesis
VSERTDPRFEDVDPVVAAVRRIVYRSSRVVVAQTDDVAEWLRRATRASVSVIPNPVRHELLNRAGWRPGGRTVVSIGRLNRAKGYEVLIDAFERFAGNRPDWTLVIHGEGELRQELAARIAASRVPERVRMPGVTNDPEGALVGAGMFVSSSRWEGFPNVLLEAMALGVPTIATRVPSAHALIADGTAMSVPVDDVGAMADAIAAVAGDDALAKRLSTQGRTVARQFDLDTIGDRWDDALAIAPREPGSPRPSSQQGHP